MQLYQIFFLFLVFTALEMLVFHSNIAALPPSITTPEFSASESISPYSVVRAPNKRDSLHIDTPPQEPTIQQGQEQVNLPKDQVTPEEKIISTPQEQLIQQETIPLKVSKEQVTPQEIIPTPHEQTIPQEPQNHLIPQEQTIPEQAPQNEAVQQTQVPQEQRVKPKRHNHKMNSRANSASGRQPSRPSTKDAPVPHQTQQSHQTQATQSPQDIKVFQFSDIYLTLLCLNPPQINMINRTTTKP
jgi:hypothetical protein